MRPPRGAREGEISSRGFAALMLAGVATLSVAWAVSRMRGADPVAPSGLVVAPLPGGAAARAAGGAGVRPRAGKADAAGEEQARRAQPAADSAGALAAGRAAVPRSAIVLRGPARHVPDDRGGALHVQDLSGLVIVRPEQVVETVRPADRPSASAEPETVLHLIDGRAVAIPDPVYEALPRAWRYRADYVRESGNVLPSEHVETRAEGASAGASAGGSASGATTPRDGVPDPSTGAPALAPR